MKPWLVFLVAFVVTPLAFAAGWPFVLILAACLWAVVIAPHIRNRTRRDRNHE